jgi:hypothetical protein
MGISHSRLAVTGASIVAVALLAGCFGGDDDENARTVTVTTTVKEQVAVVPESTKAKGKREGRQQERRRTEGVPPAVEENRQVGPGPLRQGGRREGRPILSCIQKFGGFEQFGAGEGSGGPPRSQAEREELRKKVQACIKENLGDRFGEGQRFGPAGGRGGYGGGRGDFGQGE